MVRGAGRGGALSGGNGCYERPSRQNAATSLGRGLTRLVKVALSVYCSFQSCTSKLPRSLRSFGCTPVPKRLLPRPSLLLLRVADPGFGPFC